jgi:hypothetical protein
MSHVRRPPPVLLAFLAVLSGVPPLGDLLLGTMFTQMLVQIPLLFCAGGVLAGLVCWPDHTRWEAWNVQGASGLLTSALVLTFWMTPIALDHAAVEYSWEVAKVASVVVVGFVAGASWRLASGITRIFYLGNMLWMTVTIGMLYEESPQRFCNAYLWDDQAITGRGLVVASLGVALLWTSRTVRIESKKRDLEIRCRQQ